MAPTFFGVLKHILANQSLIHESAEDLLYDIQLLWTLAPLAKEKDIKLLDDMIKDATTTRVEGEHLAVLSLYDILEFSGLDREVADRMAPKNQLQTTFSDKKLKYLSFFSDYSVVFDHIILE